MVTAELKEKLDDLCETHFIDVDRAKAVQRSMKPDPVIHSLSDIFKVLGDPTRVKILMALSYRELCVCDIANLIGLTVSAISHQLRLLRNLRLVKHRKEGRMVYYSLDDPHIEDLFKAGLEHVLEKE